MALSVGRPHELRTLSIAAGGLIDRSQVLRFTFDGRSLTGFAGDTLASALLANQVRVVSRSMKFHRPHGVLSCGIEEPNALVEFGEGAITVPTARATVTSLVDGLKAKAQAGCRALVLMCYASWMLWLRSSSRVSITKHSCGRHGAGSNPLFAVSLGPRAFPDPARPRLLPSPQRALRCSCSRWRRCWPERGIGCCSSRPKGLACRAG